jgi:two-component system, OmpR family, phosphate regulon sensor histidine kinase PhoR
MRSKNRLLLLGIGSIIIMTSIQLFIIGGVWKQKYEMFDLRYKTLSQEAMAVIGKQKHTDGFDTAMYLVNNYADTFMNKGMYSISDQKVLDKKKKEIFTDIYKILILEQDLSGMLSSYFQQQGFEKDFNFQIAINSLQLINFDTKIDILPSPMLGKPGQLKVVYPVKDPKKMRSRILVNHFFREDNYYSIAFDYYIDFSDKRILVLRDMSASLIMSVFSIIVVVIIFMITYRNLMEERRLSNLKTDFINNMTHELKTPLSTITVAGKTLEMEQIRSNDAKILETAKLIGKQSVHLNQLINLILEISMWERTQFQLDKKNVEIEELMHEIVESFRSGCGNCASITQEYSFGGAKTDIDVVYFTTMINNLLTNAVKYSDKEPAITIEGYRDKENLYIKVADNGIGIEKTEQKHIFDKFYRVNTGNIHKIKGLGLGLYYVKKIAESHGGDVSVSSKPGKGSIFTVTIPY